MASYKKLDGYLEVRPVCLDLCLCIGTLLDSVRTAATEHSAVLLLHL